MIQATDSFKMLIHSNEWVKSQPSSKQRRNWFCCDLLSLPELKQELKCKLRSINFSFIELLYIAYIAASLLFLYLFQTVVASKCFYKGEFNLKQVNPNVEQYFWLNHPFSKLLLWLECPSDGNLSRLEYKQYVNKHKSLHKKAAHFMWIFFGKQFT